MLGLQKSGLWMLKLITEHAPEYSQRILIVNQTPVLYRNMTSHHRNTISGRLDTMRQPFGTGAKF